MDKYIPNEILTSFTTFYETENVWQIHSGNYWLTIFLYKESQIEDNRDLPKYLKMKEEYFTLINKYLGSPLSSVNEVSISFDSKESFEKKFGGNWYDYYH